MKMLLFERKIFMGALLVLAIFLNNGCKVYSLQYTIFDAAAEILNATGGVIESIPKSIPKPEDFFEMGKNAVLGYPAVVAMEIVNTFCTQAISMSAIKVAPKFTPNIASMAFVLKTPGITIEIPLMTPDVLWKHPQFRSDYPTEIIVTGWKTDLDAGPSKSQQALYKAFATRNVNFIAIDTANYVDTLYAWSALNTEAIGEYLGYALQMFNKTYPIESVHLIGHSLGANICGAAGRYFNQKSGFLLPHITGLDPAYPCFGQGEELSGLIRGDADFVDVIHTNPGVLGKRDPIGDIDFFCNGLQPLQPGCFDISCSHQRAWAYYAETVYPGNENNLMAVQCSSMMALNSNACQLDPIPMGYAVPRKKKGNYFLKTNSQSPYGLNAPKLRANFGL